MKNKYTLYLLLCGVLLYFAVQKLNIFATGLEGIFAIIWLLFALFVIGGNVVGLLFATSSRAKRKITREKQYRLRSYDRS